MNGLDFDRWQREKQGGDSLTGIKNLAVAVIESALRDYRAEKPCDIKPFPFKKCLKCNKTKICNKVIIWQNAKKEAKHFLNGEGVEIWAKIIGYGDPYIKKMKEAIFTNDN